MENLRMKCKCGNDLVSPDMWFLRKKVDMYCKKKKWWNFWKHY